ncbi:fibrous sheath-interacting protein 1-like [Watersipora subatra]|uniref:fibrous sheath-interacting protein 1-like n=1 Tax=Watersipora subatra TaxID=2589382 RepID=UPI00355AD1F4
MKEEMKHLTSGQNTKTEEDDIDPRVKEALLQMRKYDRILEKRSRRERRVKRERIALQKKLREELEELSHERPSGCKSTRDESVNTEKFLSLPPSIARLDKEVPENSEDEDWSGAPLFATQPPTFDSASSKGSKSSRMGGGGRADDASSTAGSQSTNRTGNTTDHRKQRRRKKKMFDADGKPIGDKDFIQRNIDLAADAGNAVAMTDDEKKRLADILENLDEVDDTTLEQGMTTSELSVHPGEGFALDSRSQHVMKEIDMKLEGLMGAEEYSSIVAPSQVTYDSLQLFSRTHNQGMDSDIAEIGERALQETKEYRGQQKRLADIERELENLSTAVQSEIESPMLSDHQLHVLLDQCNKMMSRATIETDSLSQANSPRSAHSSTREASMVIKPHLDESVLKSLLDQARSEGIVSRNETVNQNPDEDSRELISDNQRENLLLNPRTTSRAAVNGTF